MKCFVDVGLVRATYVSVLYPTDERARQQTPSLTSSGRAGQAGLDLTVDKRRRRVPAGGLNGRLTCHVHAAGHFLFGGSQPCRATSNFESKFGQEANRFHQHKKVGLFQRLPTISYIHGNFPGE